MPGRYPPRYLAPQAWGYCIANPDEDAASGYPLDVVEKLFMKLA